MRTVKANVSVGSGGESGTGSHLKAWIILAGSRFTCSKPKVKAGQILRPTPKGAIFTPFIPFKSTPTQSPVKYLSGWNLWILCHLGSVEFHIYTCWNAVLSQLRVTRRSAQEGGTGRSPLQCYLARLGWLGPAPNGALPIMLQWLMSLSLQR